MLRRFLHAWTLLLLGASEALAGAPNEQCRDDFSTCREDCSAEYGTVAAKRPNLLRCVGFCEDAYRACLDRTLESSRTPTAPPTSPSAPTAKKEPKDGATPAPSASPSPSAASSFSSAEEVERLGTTPTKSKTTGKKAGSGSPPPASAGESDLTTWDPNRP